MTACTQKILFLSFYYLMHSIHCQYYTIVVDSTNCSDPNVTNCTSSCTVCNLREGLSYLQELGNNTEIKIAHGTYNLSDSNLITFSWFNNIAIRGIGEVHLQCDPAIGFTFLYCNNITLEQITLHYCGKEQISTSLRFNQINTTSYVHFNVSLYILYCKNIQFISVNVISSNGSGIQIYGTAGSNIFKNCNFIGNRSPFEGPGGGGLYIEFPFCSPGDVNCTSLFTNVSEQWTSNSSYTIQDCLFDSNFATTVSAQDSVFVPYVPGGRNNVAFARGGGLSIFFKGNATNNTMTVTKCQFTNNVATWGAGLFVEFQDLSTSNSLVVENVYFDSNYCNDNALFGDGTTGGGARIGFIYYYPNHAFKNTVLFEKTTFRNNSAYWGGGVSFYTANENTITPSNSVKFSNCLWAMNHGRIGSAVDLMLWHQSIKGVAMTVEFYNSNFSANRNLYDSTKGTVSNSVGFGTFFTDSIPVNFSGQIAFVNNSESALIGIAAAISFTSDCNAAFENNTGRYGGAVQLLAYAFIQVYDYTTISFERNFATFEGGAMYSEGIGEQDSLTASTACFIRYYDINVGPYNWTAQFNFEDNFTPEGGNSIYATSIEGCKLGGAYGPSNQNLTTPFCWGTAWNYNGQKCEKQIRSGVNVIRMTNAEGIVTFPGNQAHLPIVLLDDLNATITTPQILGISVLPNNDIVSTTSSYISDNLATFKGLENSHARCKVETINPTVVIYINVTLVNCPPGYVLMNDICICIDGSYNGLVKCSAGGPTIQHGAWIGTLPNSNDTFYVGYSPYLSQSDSLQFSNVTTNSCMPSRTGVLCAQCVNGYAPAFNDVTFPCVECLNNANYNWLIWVAVVFIPLTILFVIVVLFHVNVTSGPVNGLIFFAQMFVLTNSELSSGAAGRVYITMYSIANLDFFFGHLLSPICLAEQIQNLEFISMKYLEALYPTILLLITSTLIYLYDNGIQPVYFIFHPLHKCSVRIKRKINLRTSVTDGFSTFIVLAYAKIAYVSLYVLVPTSMYTQNGTILDQQRLYYMGSIEYSSPKHIPFFVLSLVILTFLILLPPLILVLYPLGIFRRCLEFFRCCCCNGAKFSHLMDTIQGCYKNGTNKTRDYRFFAGLYLVYRVVLLLCSLEREYFLQFVIKQLVLMTMGLSFAVFRPYVNEFYNSLDTAIFLVMVAINTLNLYINNNNFVTATEHIGWVVAIRDCLIFFPVLYLIIFVVYSVWKSGFVQSRFKCVNCCRKNRFHPLISQSTEPFEDDDFLTTMDHQGAD